jgi:hypothetical protein
MENKEKSQIGTCLQKATSQNGSYVENVTVV